MRQPRRRRVFPDHHQPIGVQVRQRSNQNGVDGRKDCGVGANPKGEREDRDSREAGRPAQSPYCISQIPTGIIQPYERAGVAMQILRLRHAAERPFRGEPRFFTG